MEFSLIVPVYNRETHLINLLKGVQQASVQPSEIIIVNMGGALELPKFNAITLRIIQCPIGNNTVLPLAKARNLGAESASTDTLFFLDVDCIPSVGYFKNMCKQLDVYKGLIMGTPKYLLGPVSEAFDDSELKKNSTLHPYRPVINGCEISLNPGNFWSLCFAMSKVLFNRIGGFDEAYHGYGAEDTDLAFTLREKGYYLFISEAIVYHQQHPVHTPPFDKFHQIIENSTVFFKKWGSWPMGNWLQKFNDEGLIDWAPHYKGITVFKKPSVQQLQSAYKKNAPFM